MSAALGRDMQVRIKDETEAFVLFAGLQTKSLKFVAQTLDATHLESDQQWQELLPGMGVKSADISGAGLFVSSVSGVLARALFFEQSLRDYQFILPGFGVIEGAFLMTELSYSGVHAGSAQYELRLQSSGALSFTPPA